MELPFGQIIKLREDIAEVIINEGIEMDLNMVNQYHEWLLSHLKSPFSILVNKVNSYTYDFEAQMALGTLKEINVMAVVVYNNAAKFSTEDLASRPRIKDWNISIFSNREQALTWLKLNQEILTDQAKNN